MERIVFCKYNYDQKPIMERVADTLSAPVRYILNGHTVEAFSSPEDIQPSFEKRSWWRAALAIAAFIPSLILSTPFYFFTPTNNPRLLSFSFNYDGKPMSERVFDIISRPVYELFTKHVVFDVKEAKISHIQLKNLNTIVKILFLVPSLLLTPLVALYDSVVHPTLGLREPHVIQLERLKKQINSAEAWDNPKIVSRFGKFLQARKEKAIRLLEQDGWEKKYEDVNSETYYTAVGDYSFLNLLLIARHRGYFDSEEKIQFPESANSSFIPKEWGAWEKEVKDKLRRDEINQRTINVLNEAEKPEDFESDLIYVSQIQNNIYQGINFKSFS